MNPILLSFELGMDHYLDRAGEGIDFQIELEFDIEAFNNDKVLNSSHYRILKVEADHGSKRYLNSFHPECASYWQTQITNELKSGKLNERILDEVAEINDDIDIDWAIQNLR